jgi:acyl-CoA reductase-like NAD-dependent aldehyde dehydrogenase
MSIVEPVTWYREATRKVTSHDEVNKCLADLERGKKRLRSMPIRQMIALAEACLDGLVEHADEWVRAACEFKGLPFGTPLGSEDMANGPLATSRYLRLVIRSLSEIERDGVPQLPGSMVEGPDGKLRVQVMPAKGLFDAVAFSGFKAHVVQQPGVNRDNLRDNMAGYYRRGRQEEGIALVLGAGNVSSIPATDAFTKIFQEGKAVLVKMNPVNEYVGPIFERAFAPLIEADLLRIVYGGAEVGSHALQHALVDEVHITGSVFSHDAIVWGPPGPERDRRKRENDPLLKKPISSELGNVSPWIVVPGPYSDAQLKFQAENLASSILNNCSFNCVATKVVLTWKSWPQREQFIGYVEEVLRNQAPRKAYYPGAEDRYRKFTGQDPAGVPAGALPWTFKAGVDPEQHPLYFDEESFCPVTVETSLDAASEANFLQQAVDFANNRLFGTLGCTVMVHPSFRKDAGNEKVFQQALCDLRYGTVGINYWSALSYAIITPPWGGHPGATLQNPESGIGWVHNTYMFDRPEKSIFEGPITLFPKPLWFPSNRAADKVTRQVVSLYHRPSIFKLGPMLIAALRG